MSIYLLLILSLEGGFLLEGNTLLTPVPGSLCLVPASLCLVAEHLSTRIVGLLLVNELHEGTLVLERVTLDLQVQFTVQLSVNLLVLTVLLQHAPRNTGASHPQDLGGHTGLLSTLPFTKAHVSALSALFSHLTSTEAGVDIVGFLNNKTILDELANVLSGVSLSNFCNFIRV